MQINKTKKTRSNASTGSGKTTHSPEQIQELCTQNPYLRGWLEAFYNLSNWSDNKLAESNSISTPEVTAIEP